MEKNISFFGLIIIFFIIGFKNTFKLIGRVNEKRKKNNNK